MNRIKDLREDRDLKQSELAEIINTSQQNLSNYEQEKSSPTKEIWIKLANYFEVTTDFLMGKTNNPQNEMFTNGLTTEEIQKLIEYKEMLIAYRAVKKK